MKTEIECREQILKRYPMWDGDVNSLEELMKPEVIEVWFNPEKNTWVWLDLAFDLAYSHEDRTTAILQGAAQTCYWCDDYDTYVREHTHEE